MSDAIFPALKGATYPVIKKPTFSTIEQESVSGKKKQIANWLYPRWQIEIPYEFLRDDVTHNELKTLVGFFLARRGKFDSFLFDDPDDDYVAGQPIGVGDGVTTSFQLLRIYGGFTEPVMNIKTTPAAVIYANGVALGSGLYAISMTDSGILNITTAPGAGVAITADFGYYWRCRFQEDLSEFQKFLYQLWEHKGIKIETVK